MIRKKGRFFLICILFFFFILFFNFNIIDNYLGIFILKKSDGIGFEIKNDIYPDDIKNIIFAIDLEDFFQHIGVNQLFSNLNDYPKLDYIWDENNGRGVIKNMLDDNKKIYVSFSRFKDDSGFVPKGLFLGGGLPRDLTNESPEQLNETGMAYYDGKKWYHIWCSANEGISTGYNYSSKIPPSLWDFKGSRILKKTEKELMIKSVHEVALNNSILKIDRYAYFQAGEPYFLLFINFKNIGKEPVDFIYVYGDEPWLGEYGSSVGDVGWVKDGLIFHEGPIDINKYDFLGFYDIGNMYAGEGNVYSGIANFIQWLYEKSKPDIAYFSNETGNYSDKKLVPLNSKYNRNLSLEWGPKKLLPNKEFFISLAIGMVKEYQFGIPIKPSIKINKNTFF